MKQITAQRGRIRGEGENTELWCKDCKKWLPYTHFPIRRQSDTTERRASQCKPHYSKRKTKGKLYRSNKVSYEERQKLGKELADEWKVP